MTVVKYQLHQLSQCRDSQPGVSTLWALVTQQAKELFRTRQYRHRMARRLHPHHSELQHLAILRNQ